MSGNRLNIPSGNWFKHSVGKPVCHQRSAASAARPFNIPPESHSRLKIRLQERCVPAHAQTRGLFPRNIPCEYSQEIFPGEHFLPNILGGIFLGVFLGVFLFKDPYFPASYGNCVLGPNYNTSVTSPGRAVPHLTL